MVDFKSDTHPYIPCSRGFWSGTSRRRSHKWRFKLRRFGGRIWMSRFAFRGDGRAKANGWVTAILSFSYLSPGSKSLILQTLTSPPNPTAASKFPSGDIAI